MWVRAVSLLVPGERRSDWCEEWYAELAARRAEDSLARPAWGALPDAWALRRDVVPLEGAGRDVRWAWRSLWRSPAFTIPAVATLGLGLGSVAALFSVVNGVLARPLPYPHADRLVRVDGVSGDGGVLPLSRPDWRDWNDAQTALTGLASYLPVTVETVLGGSEPARLRVRRVSWNFFSVLGSPLQLGRGFGEGESGRGAPPVAVLGDGAWKRLFGGAGDLATIRLDLLGESHSVVGVTRPGFAFLEPTDIWILHEREPLWEVRAWPTFGTVGRLRDETGLAAAEQEFSALAARGRAQHGDFTMATRARVQPLREWAVSGVRGTLLTLFAAAGFVMLVACANVASALLARGTARMKDVALRRAIGATRSRVLRELLVESVLLAAMGAALGLLLAWAGLGLLSRAGGGLLPRLGDVRLDGAVVAFAGVTALLAVLLFGAAPAVASSGAGLGTQLRAVGRGRRRAWSALIGTEVALATALAIGLGLLVRSVIAIQRVPMGWDPRDLVILQAALPPSRYPDALARTRFVQALSERVAAVPGIQAAGVTSRLPLERFEDTAPAYTPERGFPGAAYSGFRVVDSAYFGALRVPLVRGRLFRAEDGAGAPDAAIVSESLAAALWPGEDALGKRVRHNNDFGWSGDDDWLTVVGVVGNVRHWASPAGSQHELYVPYTQRGERAATMTWVVRSGLSLGTVAAALRQEVRALDPSVPVSLLAMDERISATYRDRRFAMTLLAAFALTAVLLAVIGIAGVVAYAVERRTREIGIRVALGARPSTVMAGLQRQTLVPAAWGALIGAVSALLLARALSGLLFGVQTWDPWAHGAAILVLMSSAWLGGRVPARRALRVSPAEVLRSD
jgi:predicted permease